MNKKDEIKVLLNEYWHEKQRRFMKSRPITLEGIELIEGMVNEEYSNKFLELLK